MYTTYIIESADSNLWYYGHTDNIERRLTEHNEGRSKWTKKRKPWRLVFRCDFDTRAEAMAFEKKLKNYRNKGFIEKEFSQYFLK